MPKFKVALIGATGATGREIVKWAVECEHVTEMTLIVRRKLAEWVKDEEWEPKFYNKIKIITKENFD